MNQATEIRKKKVLFVITKSNFGGAQRYVYDLARSLPTDAYEPVVLMGAAPGTPSGGALFTMLKEAHIRTIFIPELDRDVSFLKDLRAFNLIAGALRNEEPDIVHLNSSKAAGLGALAARLTGRSRIIFTAHGWAFGEERNVAQRWLIWALSWLTVALSHATICVSESDRVHAAGMPLVQKKLHTIHNGIESFPLLERAAARERLVGPAVAASHAGDTWIISNAELTANKNLFTALDAIAQMQTSWVFYVLMSDGEQRQALESHAAKLFLTGKVQFLGFVPNGREYLQAFDIFFLPSKKEGLPYAILEAGVASLPVVASNVGGIPEIIENGVHGRISHPHDTDAFAASLSDLASNTEERAQMGSKLHGRITTDFRLERMVENTVALYQTA